MCFFKYQNTDAVIDHKEENFQVVHVSHTAIPEMTKHWKMTLMKNSKFYCGNVICTSLLPYHTLKLVVGNA